MLRAHDRWGIGSLERLRGMFAYAIWDEPAQELVCARDRFGIKPFYYAVVDDVFYFASEAKALLPFLPSIETDLEGLKDYLAFQFCLAGKTLFKGVRELQPGHMLRIRRGAATPPALLGGLLRRRLRAHARRYFEERIEQLLAESVAASTCEATCRSRPTSRAASTRAPSPPWRAASRAASTRSPGSSPRTPRYDESGYARLLATQRGLDLHEVDIGVEDFIENIESVAYHMDYPGGRARAPSPSTWSPRPRPEQVKVILGGQGGDEIFGGYTRYLIAYFEQCIKGAIEGTLARRQLRRHLRVDHPQPGRAPELQADAPGLLAARGCSRTSTPATSG